MKMNYDVDLFHIFTALDHIILNIIINAFISSATVSTTRIIVVMNVFEDKYDDEESKLSQALVEVGRNFCPLYGRAIVPLGCVPKVFSSDDNFLS